MVPMSYLIIKSQMRHSSNNIQTAVPVMTRSIPFVPSSASMIRVRATNPMGSGNSLRPK
jgi:hypothetical protein